MALAIDVSNYNQDVGRVVDDMRQLSPAKVIVGLQYPGPAYPPGNAHLMIPALLNAGFRVEVYAQSQSIVHTWPMVAQWRDYIERVWVAAEEDHVDALWLDRELDFADSLELPEQAGIYTGSWWWRSRAIDLLGFAGRPLWAAQYDDVADYRAFVPFGGWTKCEMKQYNGIPPYDRNDFRERTPAYETASGVTATPLSFSETHRLAEELFRDFNDVASDQRGNAAFRVSGASYLFGAPMPEDKEAFLLLLDKGRI